MRSSASSTWRISVRSSSNRGSSDNPATVSALRSRTQSSAAGPVTSSSHRYGSFIRITPLEMSALFGPHTLRIFDLPQVYSPPDPARMTDGGGDLAHVRSPLSHPPRPQLPGGGGHP